MGRRRPQIKPKTTKNIGESWDTLPMELLRNGIAPRVQGMEMPLNKSGMQPIHKN
jgi:hypothetical protein